jgi:hypothetical protein
VQDITTSVLETSRRAKATPPKFSFSVAPLFSRVTTLLQISFLKAVKRNKPP